MRADIARAFSKRWNEYEAFRRDMGNLIKAVGSKKEKYRMYKMVCNEDPTKYSNINEFFRKGKTSGNCKLLAWEIEQNRL